jgi:hypothetical protein
MSSRHGILILCSTCLNESSQLTDFEAFQHLIDQTSLIQSPMKRVVVALAVMMLLVVLIGADIRRTDSTPPVQAVKIQAKKKCYGYTIIEFGKGINCKGDTINLVRVDGIQRLQNEVASAE